MLGAFLLLMMVFRSILVPLKAAVMNLLSIGAAYGVIVAVFQWGWGRGLIGLHEAMPIVAFVPLMMFAILFGLSMDYEVFLLSRIREEYLRLGRQPRGRRDRAGQDGRVITSAALDHDLGVPVVRHEPRQPVKMIGLGSRSRCSSTRRSSGSCSSPRRWSCSATRTGGCRSGSTRILPHINVDGPPPTPPAPPAAEPEAVGASIYS